MGYAFSFGITFKEIDQMSNNEFEIMIDCLEAFEKYKKGDSEKRIKIDDVRIIPTNEDGFDYFLD